MADFSISFALDKLHSFLSKQASFITGIHKEVEDIQKEQQSIQALLKEAESQPTAEAGIQTWIKELRDVDFHIDVLIDEYKAHMAKHRQPHHSRWTALFHKMACLFKTLRPSHRIASEIQEVKSSIEGIKERGKSYGFKNSFKKGSFLKTLENHGSSSSSSCYSERTRNDKWHDPRIASLFIEEAEVVGFDSSRDQLVGWLVEGTTKLTVIVVVGMAGLGKTTLSRTTFDNSKVTGHFDCHAWITVSQSYTTEGLLRSMIEKFCESMKDPPPPGINKKDKISLITLMRQYLEQKRYVICFDDVWSENFADEIQDGLRDNSKGSRIIITTRNLGVATFCKKYAIVHVHKLQPLLWEKALELFRKKAFHDCEGFCPEELEDTTSQIVAKCKGLPLAIVTIGGLLSTKEKNRLEWLKLLENLGSELETNRHLTGLARILALSFNDLPEYLKPCFLYFGIYPEDYSINCARLIRQWVAEGFVQHEQRGPKNTPEEIAEQYLKELIDRSLVQVDDVHFDGKARSCRVHDLLREMIIKKMEDLYFCCFANGSDQSFSKGKK